MNYELLIDLTKNNINEPDIESKFLEKCRVYEETLPKLSENEEYKFTTCMKREPATGSFILTVRYVPTFKYGTKENPYLPEGD